MEGERPREPCAAHISRRCLPGAESPAKRGDTESGAPSVALRGTLRVRTPDARSLAETAMYRFKTIFGPTLNARKFESQANEAFICCRVLNQMPRLGMPESYPI